MSDRFSSLCDAYQSAIERDDYQAANAILREMNGESDAQAQQFNAMVEQWQEEDEEFEEFESDLGHW